MDLFWLEDDIKGTHFLCMNKNGRIIRLGGLSPEREGKRLWRLFQKGEPQMLGGDLEEAQAVATAKVILGQ